MSIGFLHVGKTGGTAIRDVLNNHAEGKVSHHGHGKTLKTIWKYHPNKKMVFGYRDPVSRFVSGFNSRKRKGQPRYNIEWTPAERVAFEYFEDPVDLAEALSSGVRSVRSLAELSMFSIQHVKKSLLEYLGDGGFLLQSKEKILLPYNVKTLDADFEFLKKAIGLHEDVCLSKDVGVAHRSPAWMNKEMSELGKRNLEVWYKEDYSVISSLEKIREEKGLANAL